MLVSVIVCVVVLLSTRVNIILASQAGRIIKNSRNQDIELESNMSDSFSEYSTKLPANHTKLDIYTKWSPWSQCIDCQQRRMKNCIHPKCHNSKVYEERPCPRRRCKRRHRRKKDFHLVHLNSDLSHMTKQSRTRSWSKWSPWSRCTPDCRTYRMRSCRQPKRCGDRQQQQAAYCYFDNTRCEKYILDLIDQQKHLYENEAAYFDFNKYHYSAVGTVAPTRRPPKRYRINGHCGVPYKSYSMLKIIGGREARKYKWPWHVALINRYDEVFCGGTLISPRWVITAAHCLRSSLRVRFSEHDLTYLDGRELEMKVRKMFQHPGFNKSTVDNDIALLLLPRPVKIPVACLPKRIPKPRKMCSIMGWGKTNPNHLYGTPILREARIPVVHQNVCRRAYDSISITPNMLCAGWRSGRSDTCAGDSGGGLLCPSKPMKNKKIVYTIQGITSFGDGCGRHNKYGIYTSVFNYLRWVYNIMNLYS